MPQGYIYEPNAPPRSVKQCVIDRLELASFYAKIIIIGGLAAFVVAPMISVLAIVKHFTSRPLQVD